MCTCVREWACECMRLRVGTTGNVCVCVHVRVLCACVMCVVCGVCAGVRVSVCVCLYPSVCVLYMSHVGCGVSDLCVCMIHVYLCCVQKNRSL